MPAFISTSASKVPGLLGFIAVLASVLLPACGALPTQVDRPFSPARQASVDSPLARVARDSSPAPTLTGFRLLPDGFYSLDARIQLARRASDSLDVQYYLIQDDRTGRLLMRNLRDASPGSRL
jgi:cardiolipin synthase C